MRRNASMSGSTSMNSSVAVFGRTVPSLSALLFPCVRMTVFSVSSAMAFPGSAAGAGDAVGERQCVLHERRRNVVLDHVLDALEHGEMMTRALVRPERDRSLERRMPG